MFIREPAEKKKQKPTDKSARNMRRQLRTTSLGAFQRGLGLLTFEEWLKLDRAPVGSTRQQRSHYFEELRGTGDHAAHHQQAARRLGAGAPRSRSRRGDPRSRARTGAAGRATQRIVSYPAPRWSSHH